MLKQNNQRVHFFTLFVKRHVSCQSARRSKYVSRRSERSRYISCSRGKYQCISGTCWTGACWTGAFPVGEDRIGKYPIVACKFSAAAMRTERAVQFAQTFGTIFFVLLLLNRYVSLVLFSVNKNCFIVPISFLSITFINLDGDTLDCVPKLDSIISPSIFYPCCSLNIE